MITKKKTDVGNRKYICAALLINIIVAMVCIFIFRPEFETNDDSGLIAIASGTRGYRDAHMVHSNYLLGKVLTRLYVSYQEVQWWSVIQFTLLFIAFFLITFILIRKFSCIAGTLLTAAIIFFFSYEGYTNIQYTKTAGILCAAGLIMVFHGLLDKGTGSIGIEERLFITSGTLLTILGSFYRFQEFCCIVAVFISMVIYTIMYYLEESEHPKKNIVRALVVGTMLLVAVGGFRAYDRAQYKSDDWTAYLEFDKYRTEVLDYGVPDYEEYEEEYNAVGIDLTAYNLMKAWTFQDSEKFTAGTFKAIAEFRNKKEINGRFTIDFARQFAKGLLKGRTSLCLLITIAGWIVIGSHKKRNLVSLITLVAVIVVLNFYLYYAGRFMVNRVDVGVWLAAVLIVLCQYAPVRSNNGDKGVGNNFLRQTALATCFVLTVAAFTVSMSWRDSIKLGKANDEVKMTERAAIEKISSDKKHLYLTKVGTLRFSEAYGVTDAVPYQIADNIYPLGGWGSETPTFKSVLERYDVNNPFRDMINNEKVYIVDKDIEDTLSYLRRWYKSNAKAELIDTIKGHNIYSIK